MTRALVVPGPLALLPAYAGITDPLADLRAVLLDAVRDLVDGAAQVSVLADPQGARVASALLDAVGWTGGTVAGCDRILVVADGSARRGEKAPGHLDERSFGFDETVEKALLSGEPAALRDLDADLGDALLAAGTRTLQRLGRTMTGPHTTELLWSGDPFGVQYWVVRWVSG